MNLTGQFDLPVPKQKVWDSLNDTTTLMASIPGCESLEENGPETYLAVIRTKVGPVNATFKSEITRSDVVEPHSYSLTVKSQGGAAGMGEAVAHVELVDDNDGTRLDYRVDFKVQGKLAQIGSRLINNTLKKLSEEFFKRFAEISTSGH